MSKSGFVYIMTNKNRTTLYIGVTNDLCRRIYEHKNHLVKDSFTDRYNLEYCIYYEEYPFFMKAIQREKELKKWNRQKKEDLINKKNPEWKELVNEKGFVRKYTPFSEQTKDLMKELGIPSSPLSSAKIRPSERNEEIGVPPTDSNDGVSNGNGIPPSSRNDEPSKDDLAGE